MKRTPWIERKFTLDFPVGWIYNILERLHGTTPRIKYLILTLTEDLVSQRVDNKWSIKEEIGHLVDLEDLHIQRLHDFQQGVAILSAADMSNLKTEQAGHNNKDIEELITTFETKRNTFIGILEKMNEDLLSFESLHPRLKIPMRPVDIAYFTAEHDDHHLASMRNIINEIK